MCCWKSRSPGRLEEATELIELAERGGRILQVGHLERFNPGVVAAKAATTHPMFFEIHRLGVFSPRSLDVDVVFDLMIHDLDLVLWMVDSPWRDVRAVGLPVLSDKVDIANARVEFQNGAVANLTASRVSTERVRKFRYFQPNEYFSIDFTRRDATLIRVDRNGPTPQIAFRKLTATPQEPLRAELAGFRGVSSDKKSSPGRRQRGKTSPGIGRKRFELHRTTCSLRQCALGTVRGAKWGKLIQEFHER